MCSQVPAKRERQGLYTRGMWNVYKYLHTLDSCTAFVHVREIFEALTIMRFPMDNLLLFYIDVRN